MHDSTGARVRESCRGRGGAGAAAIALATRLGDGPDKSETLLFGLIDEVMKKSSTWHYIRHGYRIPENCRVEFMRETLCGILGVGVDAPLPPPTSGDGTPGSAVPHVFMVAAQQSAADGSWNPYLLTNYRRPLAAEGGRFRGPSAHDWPVREMIMATSAAPTYFKTVVKKGHEYADGGLIHNNPSLVAISEARALWKGRPIGALVSLGCGRPKADAEHSHHRARGMVSAMLYWSNHIFSMAGDTWLAHRTVKALLRTLSPETEYFRFEPSGGDVPLNEHRRAALQKMLDGTAQYIANSASRFDACAVALLRAERTHLAAEGTEALQPVPPSLVRAFTLDELEQENMMQEASLQKLRQVTRAGAQED